MHHRERDVRLTRLAKRSTVGKSSSQPRSMSLAATCAGSRPSSGSTSPFRATTIGQTVSVNVLATGLVVSSVRRRGMVELTVELHAHPPLVITHVQPHDPSTAEHELNLGPWRRQTSVDQTYACPALSWRFGPAVGDLDGGPQPRRICAAHPAPGLPPRARQGRSGGHGRMRRSLQRRTASADSGPGPPRSASGSSFVRRLRS